MVGSALRKDEASSVFWLATRAERLAHLAYSGLPALIQSKQKNCVKQTHKNHIVFDDVAKSGMRQWKGSKHKWVLWVCCFAMKQGN